MTSVPYGPLWCWNLQGEDAVFFSQHTSCWRGGHLFLFSSRMACVARCQWQYWMSEGDDSVRTPLIQCGQVAILISGGDYRCEFHSDPPGEAKPCSWCQEFAARGDKRSCPGCHATWRENGWPDFCCGETPG